MRLLTFFRCWPKSKPHLAEAENEVTENEVTENRPMVVDEPAESAEEETQLF